MKKIMKDRFMFVGTLEEAEFNRVFAGRNWNHGQSIELVLRNSRGQFLPLSYIISVMCHEMAHIEQMNHGPKFQKLNAAIKADVRQMQAKGNFGDGFWSDGKRLRDSVRTGGDNLQASDFPEYICGVTASDSRKARGQARGPRSSQTPGLVKGEASHRSGRQTEYNVKSARRNNVDMGSESTRLDGGREVTKEDRDRRKTAIDRESERLTRAGMAPTTAKRKAAERWDAENPWYKAGSTHGKTAKSKSAAEMRAEAAEKRLKSSNGAPIKLEQIKDEDSHPSIRGERPDQKPNLGDSDDEQDVPDPHIGAEDRQKEMEDEMSDDERVRLRVRWEQYLGDGHLVLLPEDSDEETGPCGEDPPLTVKKEGQADSTKPSNPVWSCHVCTFINSQDRGR